MLKTYTEFLSAVETMGIMVFSGKFVDGFPNLADLTRPGQWHTGEENTDPWRWKDRAAAEKRLAFGNILGGRKGFISRKLYPHLYSASRPDGSIEERYRWGHVKKLTYDVYKLFEAGTPLDTSEIRQQMNVTKKDGASTVDSAVITLQKEFYITVCGNRRKISFDGTEYGWPANTYCLVDNWFSDWLQEPLLPTDEARAQILTHIAALDGKIDITKTEKMLFGRS